MIEFLLGEGVGTHDVHGISLHRAHERQGHARASGGIFNDRATRPEAPIRLRRLDHGERHPVFHASGWVFAFELQQYAGAVFGRDVPQGQQRRVADAVKNVLPQFVHARTSTLVRAYLCLPRISLSESAFEFFRYPSSAAARR